MGLGKGLDSLKDKKKLAADLGKKAGDSIGEMLNELKNALSIFQTLGFRTDKLKMGGIGVGLPEMSTSIHGSVENIQVDKVNELSEQHKDSKLITMMLGALIKVKEISDHLDIVDMKGVKMEVKLGAMPKISVDLQSD
ncbi:MAG: hypothetical protein QNI97_04760 [Desulfobacterales bacterium]|nr:hypothetical protein [Desulfobacterales bacterium]